nr:hypothetical protein [Tanacetum cinerariifolium]
TTSNDFAGKGSSFDAGQSSMETRPSQDYILMPLWNDISLFDSSPKALDGDNQDNDVNTVWLSDDFFGVDNDMRSLDGVKLDISNISTTYYVPTSPNTRINQYHSFDNVIGDIQLGVQTRRMTVTTDEQRLRIEQYFQIQEYTLWDVIENGNSFKLIAETTTDDAGTSTTVIPGHVTIEEKAKKKNDVKARSMLLMALPNEHLMTFNQYKDAKTLFVAIETRFDLNLKFLRSLPSEWNTHVVVWRNKSDLDKMSLDDLYNNFKIVKQEVRGTTSINTISIASPQVSIANLSDATVYAFLANQPNGSQLVHEDLEQIHEDDLEEMDLMWQLALLSIRAKRFFQKTGKKITINGSDTAGYDKSKVECFNCHKMEHFAREYRVPRNQKKITKNQETTRRTVNMEDASSKAMVAIDEASFDWSYMAGDEAPTNMAFKALSGSENLINLGVTWPTIKED